MNYWWDGKHVAIDQTAPLSCLIWVYSVCTGIWFSIFWVNTILNPWYRSQESCPWHVKWMGKVLWVWNVELSIFYRAILLDILAAFKHISFETKMKTIFSPSHGSTIFIKWSKIKNHVSGKMFRQTPCSVITGNKLEGDVGDTAGSNVSVFQLREKLKCIEHKDKTETKA